jgi:hypothetical protein
MFRTQLFLLIILVIITSIYYTKKNNKIKIEYEIFKQFMRNLTLEFLKFLLVSQIVLNKIISINNFDSSVIGKAIISTVLYTFYLQFVYPRVNNLKIFL